MVLHGGLKALGLMIFLSSTFSTLRACTVAVPGASSLPARNDFSCTESELGTAMVKSFHDLSEKEILALAISLEEEAGKIYEEFPDRIKEKFPATASPL